MKSRKHIGLVCWAVLLILLTAVPCFAGKRGLSAGAPGEGAFPWEPADDRVAKYEYLYYPDSSVYFDTARELYFFPQDDRWIKSPTLPVEIRRGLGEFVILKMGTYKPYLFHSDVTRKYPSSKSEVRSTDIAKPEPAGEASPSREALHRGEHRYLYYPAAFVYYDPAKGVYYYRSDGQWLQSPKLPEEIAGHKGDAVTLRMNVDPPMLNHAEVVQKYPHPGYDVNVQKIIKVKRIYKK